MRASTEPLGELEEALKSTETVKSDLEDSEMTLQTETGSSSEEEGGGWFGGMSADFRVLASSIKNTAGGVASFVHRSALSVAAEIAALEHDEDTEHGEHCAKSSSGEGGPLRLPWEVKSEESTFNEDTLLKEKIMSLSSKESTFLQPFSSQKQDGAGDHHTNEQDVFVLDESRIQLIRQLLELDDQLAATHARLSGRSDVRETVFWRNYFHHCTETRDEHMRQFGPNTSVDVASDEMSFVCVRDPTSSAPTSLNSDACYSLGDLVIVDSDESQNNLDDGV
jgi:hypothetical protein